MVHKYIKRFLCLLLVAVLLLNTSCKKGWLDVNYDPSQLGDQNVTPDLMLPSILLNTHSESSPLQRWMGYWCIPPSVPPGFEEQTYSISFASRYFEAAIPTGEVSAVAAIKMLEQKAQQSNQTFYLGIAKTVGAIFWSRHVDKYNKVPYTEAFRSDILKPKYDDGKLIYEDLIKQLNESISLIKGANISSNTRIEQADIMFHGSKPKWVKFINTLKLRLLLRQANRADRAGYIQAEIAKIVAEGSGFLNSGEDASVNPGYTEVKPSPYYVAYQHLRTDWIVFDRALLHNNYELAAANFFAMELYKINHDPRLDFFYSPIRNAVPPGALEPFAQALPDNFRGNKFGLAVDTRFYNYQGEFYISLIGGTPTYGPVTPASCGLLKGYNMSGWVITSVESLFLQAEAIQRGLLQGNAEAAYKDAVQESFRWLNVGLNSNAPALSDAVFNTWYNTEVANSNTQVSWGSAPDKYKLIMLQKYLALNGIDAFETWCDYRRNGRFPQIPNSLDPNVISPVMPLRFAYSQNEYLTNYENVTAQGQINIFTNKIWWMP